MRARRGEFERHGRNLNPAGVVKRNASPAIIELSSGDAIDILETTADAVQYTYAVAAAVVVCCRCTDLYKSLLGR